MPKNYLLIYSEQLATEIELLCQSIKAPSNTLFQIRKSSTVFMQISVKQIMGRVKRICFQNLKLLLRNVVKPKVGCACYITQKASMKQPTKTTEIFAAELDGC